MKGQSLETCVEQAIQTLTPLHPLERKFNSDLLNLIVEYIELAQFNQGQVSEQTLETLQTRLGELVEDALDSWSEDELRQISRSRYLRQALFQVEQLLEVGSMLALAGKDPAQHFSDVVQVNKEANRRLAAQNK